MRKLLLIVLLGLVGAATAAPNLLEIRPGSGPGSLSSMIRPAPAYVDARVLAANVAESQTVPTGANWVLFSSTCNFFAHPSATATVPAADTTTGVASELNPAAWKLTSSITTISVIASATCTVTMSFYY